jgi:hypothetical protein
MGSTEQQARCHANPEAIRALEGVDSAGSRTSCVEGARTRRKAALADGTIDARAAPGGTNMTPFVAALVAFTFMASVFVVFGLVPAWRTKTH